MSPLIEKDATINVNSIQNLCEGTKPENQESAKPYFFLEFLEKCTKWLNVEELSKWKRKQDVCQLQKIPVFILFISVLELFHRQEKQLQLFFAASVITSITINAPVVLMLLLLIVFTPLLHVIKVIVYLTANDKLREILLYDSYNKKEIWRFLTYMLLHTDAIHLAQNILIQGLFGTPLEFEQGPLRCAATYFGGGLAGSLGTLAFATLPLMAGASGGVYALLTSQIPNILLNYGSIRYAGYRIVTVFVLIASDVIYIFCHVYFYNNERPRIGWVAHASGAAAGVLLGFLFFNGTSKWNRKFRI